MILPIHLYGDSILRKKCREITPNFFGLNELINNMFDTMYQANGIGLAAPQVGLDIKLFIIDASCIAKDKNFDLLKNNLKQFKKVFINPKIIKEQGYKTKFLEGCLSIPFISEEIYRNEALILDYYDEKFNKKIDFFSDIYARIIQHEYDHIHGTLFIDYLSKMKRKLIDQKLKNLLNK